MRHIDFGGGQGRSRRDPAGLTRDVLAPGAMPSSAWACPCPGMATRTTPWHPAWSVDSKQIMTKIKATSELRKGRGRRLIVAAVILLWLLWLVGQMFRDGTWLTSLLFYVPSPALLLLLIGGSCYAYRANRRAVAGLLAGLALAPAVFVLCVENRLCTGRQDGPDGDTLRLVHWNVFHGHLGWDGIRSALQRRGADLYVLSEIPEKADIRATATSFGQDYSGIRISNLAVVARGPLREGEWLRRQGGVKAYGLVWQSPQGGCRVLVVDLASSLLLAREPRLLAVRELMVEWRADIVVGDFNAPRRSRALSPLPPGFVHAYEAAGSGWSYTWPLPCPVYAIDQCILGQRIRPVMYDLESSLRSDHRRQLFDFTMTRKDHQGTSATPDKLRR